MTEEELIKHYLDSEKLRKIFISYTDANGHNAFEYAYKNEKTNPWMS